MLRIVALGLCLMAMPSQAFAIGLYCAVLENNIPPLEARRPPTVHYEVHTVPAAEMGTIYCPGHAGEIVGCTYRAVQGWRWVIIISDLVSADDYPCVVEYEKAHLPPNCWGSPRMETPETMAWLNGMDRVSCPR